jgi:ABC-2 type transport system permease protein
MKQAAAILWAQWRMMRNFTLGGGAALRVILGTVWYGAVAAGAAAVAWAASQPALAQEVGAALPGLLVLAMLYWQLAPLLMAATGLALDLNKLQVYPIPTPNLFWLEVMLRITGAVEMMLLTVGLALGLVINPAVPKVSLFAVLLWIGFNLLLATGLRDLLGRLLARRRVREVVFFLIMMLAVIPQFLVNEAERPGAAPGRLQALLSTARGGMAAWFWPWSAVGAFVRNDRMIRAAAVLLAWTAIAWAFSRWQFARVLRFDTQAAGAAPVKDTSAPAWLIHFYELPSRLFRDPVGALVEKDVRFLLRAPRFRVLFIMGFTFGILFWLPILFGQAAGPRSAIAAHFLTIAAGYSLLLLGEACFWNAFGFDRSAAQVYFLAPIPFSQVLIAKNLAASLFIALEFLAITAVSAILRVPLNTSALGEAVVVIAVASLLLLAAGNLVSVYQARGTDPSKSFRNSAAARIQALLMLVYPVLALPVGLAFLARWALDSEWAFYGVMVFNAAAAAAIYRIALDSAADAAARRKEQMLAALSEGASMISA